MSVSHDISHMLDRFTEEMLELERSLVVVRRASHFLLRLSMA